MMATNENDANKANYDEIRGHIDIIKAKLASTPKPEGARERLEEDLEDHYERLVQMRIYRIGTLEQLLLEQKTALNELRGNFRRVNTQRIGLTVVALLTIVVAVSEVLDPGVVEKTAKNLPIWSVLSHAAAALVAVLSLRPRAA